MKEYNFSACDFSFNYPNNDMLYEFLNLDNQDVFDFDNKSLNNSQYSESIQLNEIKPYNHKTVFKNNDVHSLSFTKAIDPIMQCCGPINNTLSMGVEMNIPSETMMKQERVNEKEIFTLDTFESTEKTLTYHSSLSESSSNAVTKCKKKIEKIEKKYKFIKRNCDLGVDTRADPDLKPSESTFKRTRGKPIKNSKKKLIKYNMSNEFFGSQNSTK